MAIIDPGGEKRGALQIDRLAIVGRRHAHVPYHHVRQTHKTALSCILAKRQSLSCRNSYGLEAATVAPPEHVGKHLFVDRGQDRQISPQIWALRGDSDNPKISRRPTIANLRIYRALRLFMRDRLVQICLSVLEGKERGFMDHATPTKRSGFKAFAAMGGAEI